MASEARTQEILKGLHETVVNFDEEKTKEWAQTVLKEGVDPLVAALDGLAEGMVEVGELYKPRIGRSPTMCRRVSAHC